MTGFDYIIIILFFVSFLVGYRKGLLKQLGLFCAVFAGTAAARAFSGTVAQWIESNGYFNRFDDENSILSIGYVRDIIVSVGIFIIVFILTKFLVSYLQVAIETLHLGWLNRIGGVIFTVFLSFLVLSVLLNVFQLFKSDGPVVPASGFYDGKLSVAVMELAPLTFGTTTSWWNNFNNRNVSIKESLSQFSDE